MFTLMKFLSFLLIVDFFTFLEAQNVTDKVLNRDKRSTIAGLVRTWNMDHAPKKLRGENSSPLKKIICKVISSSAIISLQEASQFNYEKICNGNDYISASFKQFVILVKKTLFKGITELEKHRKFFVVRLEAKNKEAKSIVVANVHLPEGVTRASSKSRKQYLGALQKKLETMVHIKDEVTLVMGDFNTISKDDVDQLRYFDDGGKKYAYIFHFDGLDPFTTPVGRHYDGILTNKGLDEGDMTVEGFPFESQEPSRFSKKPPHDMFMKQLVNNWNTAKFTPGQDKIAAALQACIKKYLNGNSICPDTWVSSQQVSDHLPLRVKAALPSGKKFTLGTWNINGQLLEDRLNYKHTYKHFAKIISEFDFLAIQEIPVSGGAEFILKEKFSVDYTLPYRKRFQHGLRISDKFQDKKSVFAKTVERYELGRYKVSIKDADETLLLCILSVHLETEIPWGYLVIILEQIHESTQADDFSECNLVLAMGDFNSMKANQGADMTKWTSYGKKVVLPVNPMDCTDETGFFKYTRISTRYRLDYIFVMKDDGKIRLGECEVLRTGNAPLKVGDWLEVSDHYPIGAHL